MKIVACIIARTNSKRLEKKVLKVVEGMSMIEHIINRVKAVEGLDDIYICTSTHEDDKVLEKIAKNNNIKFYAGSELSVIDRMIDVAKLENATHLVRITGDNIFTDTYYLQKMVEYSTNHQYIEYIRTEYLPLGVTAEIMKFDALLKCYSSISRDESEYLSWFMFDPTKYKTAILIPAKDLQNPYFNLSVDTTDDWKRVEYIFNNVDTKMINYFKICDLKREIPFFKASKNTRIKLPNNQSISFGEYRNIIEEKINKSYKIFI